MFAPAVLLMVAGLLICRLWKFFAAAPLIAPALSVTPVNMMVDVPPSIVPALATRSLPMVVVVLPKVCCRAGVVQREIEEGRIAGEQLSSAGALESDCSGARGERAAVGPIAAEGKIKGTTRKGCPAMMSRLPVMTVLPCNVLVPDPDILR